MSTKQSHGLLPHNAPRQVDRVVSTQYGHDDSHVFMQFNMPIGHLKMTVEQVNVHIENITGCRDALLRRQAENAQKAAAQGPSNG